MKILRALVPALSLVPCLSLAAEAEARETIPRDIVERLFGARPGADISVDPDVVAALPPFTLPAGFEVLASAGQGYLQRVLLRTELDVEGASAALVTAFTAEGWIEMPNAGAPRRGFVSAEEPLRQVLLCNDQVGRLGVSIAERADSRYVNLGFRNYALLGGSGRRCTREAGLLRDRGRSAGGLANTLEQYVPQLVLPETKQQPQPTGILTNTRISAADSDYTVMTQLAIDWNEQQLFEHFAEQLIAQGWLTDTATRGTADSSWTKNADDKELTGTLTLVPLTDSSWDLKFRIVPAGEAAAAAGANRSDLR